MLDPCVCSSTSKRLLLCTGKHTDFFRRYPVQKLAPFSVPSSRFHNQQVGGETVFKKYLGGSESRKFNNSMPSFAEILIYNRASFGILDDGQDKKKWFHKAPSEKHLQTVHIVQTQGLNVCVSNFSDCL